MLKYLSDKPNKVPVSCRAETKVYNIHIYVFSLFV